MEMGFSFKEGATVIALSGGIERADIRQISDSIRTLSPDGRIVIDLSGVGFFNSSLVNLFCTLTRRADSNMSNISILCPIPHLRKILLGTGIEGVYASDEGRNGGRISGTGRVEGRSSA